MRKHPRARSIGPRRCACGRFRTTGATGWQCVRCGPDKRLVPGHGRQGALARAKTLTHDERRTIAVNAAKARWNTKEKTQ